ncbi:Hpt domain-containing protein [Algoriphagus sp. CAU 1675]|uniref:Hpt domain-containing protein n=1 Tax=Algoriphagus sp. CAU 1675 TaxID=3032597 RepID=UPI0023DCA09C|nr:Hpt domain-containing protein [Algoriphagus sp. CAU 1675]MDF2157729.1 Hpt domain-containing protein [Algoriphagus sp. CAU 1675]
MYKIISEQAIHQYFGDDDPEMIIEMIQIILSTNIHDLKELNHFYEQGDYSTIKKRCHKAKPSMSYIGALKTRKILEDIEANLEQSKELNAKLQEHLNIIESELHQFLKSLS